MENGNGHFGSNGKFLPGNGITRTGAGNKASQKVREAIVKFLEDNVDKIQESFDKLKPREKLEFIADIIPYAAPKLQSIEAHHEGDIDLHMTITWVKPHELPTWNDEGSLVNGSSDQGRLPDHS